VDVFVADLSSQSEVRRLADEVLESFPRLDVLVNNVGGYWNTRHVTADGLERCTFALNHLAPFLLTNLLLDRLKQSAPARVVTVSSNAHAQGRIYFDDLQGERSYSGARAYDQSKLANVLFTYELARKLPAACVTANALHPGVVSTSFGAEDPRGVQRLFIPFMRPLMKSPAQGAVTSISIPTARSGLARELDDEPVAVGQVDAVVGDVEAPPFRPHAQERLRDPVQGRNSTLDVEPRVLGCEPLGHRRPDLASCVAAERCRPRPCELRKLIEHLVLRPIQAVTDRSRLGHPESLPQ